MIQAVNYMKNFNRIFSRLIRISFILYFSFPAHLFSLPIELGEKWLLKPTKDLSNSAEGWKEIPELPIADDIKNIEFTEERHLVTIKKEIEITSNDLKELDDTSLSLHFPYLSNYYEIYWNGNLLNKGGELSENGFKEFASIRHLIVVVPFSQIKSGKNEIRIVVGGYQGYSIDVTKVADDSPIRLDRHSENLKILSERVGLMLLFLYGFMGLYHFLFYVKRPEEQYNLYYGLFSILLAVYIFSRSHAVFELNLNAMLLKRIEYVSVFFIPGLMSFFLERYFLGKVSLPSKIYMGFVTCIALPTAFGPANYLNQFLLIWQLSVPYVLIGSVVVAVIAIRRKVQDVKRLIVGIVVIIFCAVWDVGGATGFFKFQNLGLMRYGFFVFVVGIAFILANRFLRVHKEVETLNNDLERKVEERTEALKSSLTKVNELKVQQDGDYFLTSLLINPLTSNLIEDRLEDFNIQFYSKQKKAFEFRERKLEIGGDINIVDKIQLKGKDYIVFVNGDAMGKSMQGAGGALVLGVIFHSVVTRTNSKRDSMNKGPETWLKECYLELQTVFETFDGSMLVSVSMGLIDIRTGTMFYFNAEHPWSVLYRDGKADFIENSLEIRKIGTMGIASDFRIKSFLLEPGDVIYIGSDGRDDILIGRNEKGERIINEDETLFLKCVEEGSGALEETVEAVLRKGELTDDFALIRIAYNPNSLLIDDFRAQEAERSKFIIQMAKKALRDKDYASASLNFSLAVEEFPMSIENYHYASYSFKQLRNYEEALNYGERLFLREPNHLKNLLNLADIHRYLGNRKRANFLLNRIETIDPENQVAQKIRTMLEESQKQS
jgi:serine phosphatase RsbU (regulator of sigma subunit)